MRRGTRARSHSSLRRATRAPAVSTSPTAACARWGAPARSWPAPTTSAPSGTTPPASPMRGRALLADFSWLRFSAEYTRQLRIVDADGHRPLRQRARTVIGHVAGHSRSPRSPASYSFGEQEAVHDRGRHRMRRTPRSRRTPSTVDGQPSPSRYALGSFDGSALVFAGAYFAYKPIEQLRIGIGLGALVGIFQSNVTFSVSPPDRLVAAPEQPRVRRRAVSFRVGPIFAPTGNLGVIWVPAKAAPHRRERPAARRRSARATKFDVRLPSAAVFDGARVTGNDAHVRFKLPPILRFGVETRPIRRTLLRVELAYVREFWSMHDRIELDARGRRHRGHHGPPEARRRSRRSRSRATSRTRTRIDSAAEYTFKLWGYRDGPARRRQLRDERHPAASTCRCSRSTWTRSRSAIGGGLHVGEHWRFDATYAHLFASSVERLRRRGADPAREPARRQRAARGRQRRPVRGVARTSSASARSTRSEPLRARPAERGGFRGARTDLRPNGQT